MPIIVIENALAGQQVLLRRREKREERIVSREGRKREKIIKRWHRVKFTIIVRGINVVRERVCVCC
jgi:hypothetical protein